MKTIASALILSVILISSLFSQENENILAKSKVKQITIGKPKEQPKPVFLVMSSDFSSDDGLNIRVNYPIKLKAAIQNTGDTQATNMEVIFSFINDNCFPLDKSKIQAGTIQPGDNKEVEFLFTANNQYQRFCL